MALTVLAIILIIKKCFAFQLYLGHIQVFDWTEYA